MLKWFENSYFPMILWSEPNGEVYCKHFYSAKLMKEGFSSEWRGSRMANKYTMFWISERGDNKFQVFGSGIWKGGGMY